MGLEFAVQAISLTGLNEHPKGLVCLVSERIGRIDGLLPAVVDEGVDAEGAPEQGVQTHPQPKRALGGNVDGPGARKDADESSKQPAEAPDDAARDAEPFPALG